MNNDKKVEYKIIMGNLKCLELKAMKKKAFIIFWRKYKF